jgi:hypothetical protein
MSDMQTLTQKIEELERRITTDLTRRRTANRVTLIGGAVLFILILVYFTFIHNLVTDVVEPKALTSIASEELKEYLPKAMATIQLELQKAAPEAAKEARVQAMKAFPEIRKWLEGETVHMANTYIVSLEKELTAVIQQGIVSDREAFDVFVKDPENPEAQEQFREVVRKSIRSYFDDPLVQSDLKSYSDVMKAYDTKLKRLREGVDLRRDEVLERDLIVCMRELSKRSDTPETFKP